jgi:hypothetical protein
MPKKKPAPAKPTRKVKKPSGGIVYGRDNAKRMFRTTAMLLDGNGAFTVVITVTKRGDEVTGYFDYQEAKSGATRK